MNGMSGTEFLHATVTADFIHWGVVAVIALVGWLITSWLKRRQLRRQQLRPAEGHTLERCFCTSCGNPHPRMLSRAQMRQFIADASAIDEIEGSR